ncbi:flagellar assembly peptidoglycan hydrolase FlgJ [Shewanella sp. NIFS-20-20]|uniref:flagellar assembly peptidoglycan hydrolase FlgJ n=1 Tax=Shewanella sp. NIFS-20-20 TaxID=2853806 RepID=UPI001C4934FE|nr:flagellar assembly peptidoglycan hydrolase FlgJ [Shewanella sp. NIFS-20-20]MBV7314779.1 flagellar assembly peptidoglycan hydrolase FlgJ [Shewanella sp. NIFS-20-20]
MEKLANSSHYLDLGSLDQLRARAQKDDKAALKEVAAQFEGIFVQMLMQSMRAANAVFESDSPFNSEYTKFYEQMRDQQMSVELGNQGSLGLANLMVQQLTADGSGLTPASALKGAQGRMISDVTLPSEAKAFAVATADGKDLPSPLQVAAKQTVTHNDPAQFVQQLYPHAKAAAVKLGTTPEVLLAQSALETGWGQKLIKTQAGQSSHNYFNIKADKRWHGDKAQVLTLEYEQGKGVKQQADFRVYDGVKQSFDDFVDFIQSNDRYQTAREQAASPQAFIRSLAQAGYATDPQYAPKVLRVMDAVKALIPAVGQ